MNAKPFENEEEAAEHLRKEEAAQQRASEQKMAETLGIDIDQFRREVSEAQRQANPYKISACRDCGKVKTVAKESHLCEKCANKRVVKIIDGLINLGASPHG